MRRQVNLVICPPGASKSGTTLKRRKGWNFLELGTVLAGQQMCEGRIETLGIAEASRWGHRNIIGFLGVVGPAAAVRDGLWQRRRSRPDRFVLPCVQAEA